MSCRRCPHHVRHGQLGEDGRSMVFKDLCGLRVKQGQDHDAPIRKNRGRGRPPADNVKRKPLPPGASMECKHYPFAESFDYMLCPTYQEIFETKGLRNGAVPTKDFQFSETLSNVQVTDMELL